MSKAVQIDNFSYHYPDGTEALSEISFDIEHGQRAALIGPNGAGKSTLLLAIAGFISGTGKVLIDGLEVNRANLKQIRSRIGCCMENPEDQLFMPRLFDDVAFGPMNMGLKQDQVIELVKKTLDSVGLADMAQKPGHHLSAGQKRAAAIATVLSMSPGIITLDEPDGSLDPRNRKNLEQLLRKLPQTLIIATCNMNFAASIANRVILIDNGCVIADGKPEDIMFDATLMEKHGLELPAARAGSDNHPQSIRF